jgi:hypothetical protein
VIALKGGAYALLGAVAFLTACGKEERTEAVRLAKVLSEKQADLARANTIEKDFVSSARAWCGGITTNGAGRGVELDQNATVATELAKSTVAISTELGHVRQALSAQSFKEEYPQTVSTELITRLTNRQRLLQEMRALLEKSALQFPEYRRDKTYAGDAYPGEIGKLNAILQAYRAPEDAVSAALAALKAKYKLGDNEL